MFVCFFFQAEDGIRDAQESRGLGDVYKRQVYEWEGDYLGVCAPDGDPLYAEACNDKVVGAYSLSLIHI